MSGLPKPIQELINEFSRLPGVGPKSAQRLSFYLIRSNDGKEKSLGTALINLKSELTFCDDCHNITISNPCDICEDVHRDKKIICVVEEPLDVIALEKTGQYKGLYHVLHGVLSPIDGVGPDDLKIRELVERVKAGSFDELILALNPSLEGEATSNYIQSSLTGCEISITKIAQGLPMGGDLEYADDKTLIKAMEGRRKC